MRLIKQMCEIKLHLGSHKQHYSIRIVVDISSLKKNEYDVVF